MATKKKNPPRLSANGKKIGRPRLSDDGTAVVTLRLPLGILAALDRYVVATQADPAMLGVNVTRNDVMRRLLARGLVDAGHLPRGGSP